MAPEDFEEMMVNNKGTKAMEAIWVPYFNKPCFSKESMKIMQRLRMLCIHDSNCLAGSIEYLPNSLRCLVWNNYPCESLPENFEPKTLVHLDLSFSSLHHLWMGTKVQLDSIFFSLTIAVL
ncbi:TMV resistance protein N-like isoform X2 [Lycium ferocissimum]|uniref:TMV resistance protein N-like isoform X2 n=1 Tax=Lycium ferocissimum TaxID=112874 RepID=UPI0028150BAA|nr:TMV resistance protein N-like isoform X2 [Lycium ferocissimum]